MKSKEIEVRGHSVATRAERLEKDGLVYHVEAEIGGIVHASGRMTVGPDKGIGVGDYTQEMLQRDLDAFRQKLAEEAVWRADMAEMMDRIE